MMKRWKFSVYRANCFLTWGFVKFDRKLWIHCPNGKSRRNCTTIRIPLFTESLVHDLFTARDYKIWHDEVSETMVSIKKHPIICNGKGKKEKAESKFYRTEDITILCHGLSIIQFEAHIKWY